MRLCKRVSRSGGVVMGLLMLAAVVGCAQRGSRPRGSFTPRVTVVTLKSQRVALTRELPGRTSAYLVAQVRPQVTGIIKRRLFVEGSQVRAGQPLYQLDDALYRAQYQNAKAALQKAQATMHLDELTARRSNALLKIDAISAQDDENANAALAEARADVAQAQAALQTARVNLGYARIVAPIGGHIGESTVTPGALVTANQTQALATIQQLNPIYVDVNQPAAEWLTLKREIDSGRVQSTGTGTPARIVLEDGTAYPYEGRLQFADVTVDPTTGSFLLRAVVPNPKGLLLPGMYVRAEISEGVLEHGVLVPQRAIERDPKGNATAMVVGADSRVEGRQVQVSRTIGEDWLVRSGLHAGDRVIVSGLQKVRPGMLVQAVEAGAAPGHGAGPRILGAAGGPAASYARAARLDPRH